MKHKDKRNGIPASSDDPLSGFLKFLNMAVHLVPLAAPRLRRLPPTYAVEGDTIRTWDRPEVQHCCGVDDNGSITDVLSSYAAGFVVGSQVNVTKAFGHLLAKCQEV